MVEGCAYFKEFLRSERKQLHSALVEYQKQLSKKLKKSVTLHDAEMDFIETKMWRFSGDFRRNYCGKCPGRDECSLHRMRLKKWRTVATMKVLRKTLRNTIGNKNGKKD